MGSDTFLHNISVEARRREALCRFCVIKKNMRKKCILFLDYVFLLILRRNVWPMAQCGSRCHVTEMKCARRSFMTLLIIG